MKRPEAREIVHKLAAQKRRLRAEFPQGRRASGSGSATRISRAHNPRIIYASASGYGPEGPDSGEPSFDYLGQARSGNHERIGSGSTEPIYINGGIADQMGAIMLAYGVLAALLARERTASGRRLMRRISAR